MIGVIFYGVVVYLSNSARLALLALALANRPANQISRADIELLYEKLSTANPDPTLQRALLENKAHLDSLLASMDRARLVQTSGSTTKGIRTNKNFV